MRSSVRSSAVDLKINVRRNSVETGGRSLSSSVSVGKFEMAKGDQKLYEAFLKDRFSEEKSASVVKMP